MITTQFTGRNEDLLWVDLTPYDIQFQRVERIYDAPKLIHELEVVCLRDSVPRWLELECRIEIRQHVERFREGMRLRDESRAVDKKLDRQFAIFVVLIFAMAVLWVLSYGGF